MKKIIILILTTIICIGCNVQDSFNYGVEWVYPSTQEINPPVMPARSSLSIDSKKVCTSFFQNTITLLDAEQGKILWQYDCR